MTIRARSGSARGARRALARGAAGCAAVGALLVAAAASCGATPPQRSPSLLLISIDTLRADHVHAYGYGRRTTPTLDGLAAKGARFTGAWAHSPWTLPSHATMLSGTLPFRHGVVDDGTTLRAGTPLLAELLRSRGYATAGVVSGFYVSSRFGFDRGFERFEDFGLPKEARARDSVRASEVTDRALQDLAAAGERPFFLFAHYFDCHNNYDPPAPYNRSFDEDATVVPYVNYEYYRTHPLPAGTLGHIVAQYDEEILYADAQIGRLLQGLQDRGRARDTYVVVTSDHGEELFEHGSWGHGNSLHAQVLRVPLIITGPGIPKGIVNGTLVRQEDLAATLLDLVGLAPPAASEGASYAPLARGAGPGAADHRAEGAGTPARPAAPAEKGRSEERYLLAETSRFRSNQVGSVAGERQLIVDIAGERAELYDLAADPEERHDLGASRPEEVARAFAPLARAILEAVPERWVVSWSGGASGTASIEGLLLSSPPPAPGSRLPFEKLKRWESEGASGTVRLASIPPDAPIEFLARCGRAGAGCATVAGHPAPSARPEAQGVPGTGGKSAALKAEPGAVRFRIDPVADGALLRSPEPAPRAGGGGGTSFSVRLESGTAAPIPSELTPEELERLKSLGYIH